MNILELYSQFRNNPIQLLKRRFNIPDNVNINNPNDIIQHLLNTGQVSQSQVNQAMQMRSNPDIRKLFNQ